MEETGRLTRSHSSGDRRSGELSTHPNPYAATVEGVE